MLLLLQSDAFAAVALAFVVHREPYVMSCWGSCAGSGSAMMLCKLFMGSMNMRLHHVVGFVVVMWLVAPLCIWCMWQPVKPSEVLTKCVVE
jgi:hypothetical protein